MPRLIELVSTQAKFKAKTRQTKKKTEGKVASVKQALESSRDLGRQRSISEGVYEEALSLIKGILDGRTVKGRQLNQLATKALNRLLMKDTLLLNLVNRSTSENYLYAHSVNTCILAMVVGIGLSYNKSRLVKLGIASLLHDIGMVRVLDLVSKGSKLTPEEYSEMKLHTIHGPRMLAQIEGIDCRACQLAAAEHHERKGGQGYPHILNDGEINEYARIVGLVDVYEALTHRRSYREKMLPHQALKKVADESGRLFEPDVVKALINELTIYPVGSLVKLSSGEIARVAAPNKDFPLRPVVNIIFDKEGRPLARLRSIDLSRDGDYHIKGPVDERLTAEDV